MDIDRIVLLLAVGLAVLVGLWVAASDWKAYGLLFLLSALVGESLCWIFLKLGFYSFPYRLAPGLSPMPFFAVLTVFPSYVLFGVRYSPAKWPWKIPFYWVMVHLGMVAELWAENASRLIRYDRYWNAWDSYTWWWIYLLLFEYVGGRVVPGGSRKPLNPGTLHYGRIGWLLLHFVLIVTIFLAGLYVGRVTLRE